MGWPYAGILGRFPGWFMGGCRTLGWWSLLWELSTQREAPQVAFSRVDFIPFNIPVLKVNVSKVNVYSFRLSSLMPFSSFSVMVTSSSREADDSVLQEELIIRYFFITDRESDRQEVC